MNLILLDPHEVAADQSCTLADERARHVFRVLKLAPGDSLRIGLVDGPCGTARLTASDANSVTFTCDFEPEAPTVPPVDLLLAMPRPKVMKRLWAQLAALGVGRILITNAEKVERFYFDTHVLEPDFYRGLLREGLQQARDTRMPVVSVHRELKPLLEDLVPAEFGDHLKLIADPGEHPAPAHVIGPARPARVLLAIGPEGGWNDHERTLFTRARFHPTSLGPRPLRTDTATLALLTLAHNALRE